MSAGQRLEDLQRRFAAHLRDPAGTAPPEGIEERRLRIYRELFLNNVAGLLAGTFPVLHSIYGAERWQSLVRDFYREHRCHTPLFLEIPREFLQWLADERTPSTDDPPFLGELAHYEWVELALAIDERDLADVEADRDGDLLTGVPLVSPLAWPLAYRFPVHRIGPQYQPAEPPEQPSFYIARRDRQDAVGVLHVNAVTLRLVERMQQHPALTGAAQLAALADELPRFDRAGIVANGTGTLEQLRAADVVLGTRRD